LSGPVTTLPLLERASAGDPLFVINGAAGPTGAPRNAAPLPRELAEHEQYRFHFDMTKCIGCHCCEVACNEQNGNPPHIHWRRVGEIEGGVYPLAQRFHLSMGCNHCLEPSCLRGCPVNAYQKDALTGLVLHNAEACIGCQYCTWNCPYGVPQYNEERGVVGKCDMCYGRLSQGREPACVNACPQGAIEIEVVDARRWREEFESANAPGLPPAESTFSTTRITVPDAIAANAVKVNEHRVRPEHPHWPLVIMTALTQLSVGAFGALWVRVSAGESNGIAMAAAGALAAGLIALAASTLHLGRPVYAYRALRMWRRSWLSREVLLFTLFAHAAAVYAALLWLGRAPVALGAATALLGLGGIFASARIYRVPARPAWNRPYTNIEFFLTALSCGPMLMEAVTGARGPALWLAVTAVAAQLLNQLLKLLMLARADQFELAASARLFATGLRNILVLRFALALAGIALPLCGLTAAGLIVLLCSEIAGRYLFFVSVVPTNMAATFVAPGSASRRHRRAAA
jgi:DMSO reductase iron-sulfur subunit